MGTPQLGDDVLIIADPYDTWDHWQDGYIVQPVEEFFFEWNDFNIAQKAISASAVCGRWKEEQLILGGLGKIAYEQENSNYRRRGWRCNHSRKAETQS